ncbi:Protein BCCIP homolog [Linum perenne]
MASSSSSSSNGFFFFFLFFLLIAASATVASSIPFIVLHGIGDECKSGKVTNFTQKLVNLSGSPGSCLEVGNGYWDSWFLPMKKQVELVCNKVKKMEELSNGYNIVGLSQGNLISRAVIESCTDCPPVVNYISLAGPHAGIASVPLCGNGTWCELADELIKTGVYTDFVQDHLAPSGYMKLPDDMSAYLSKSKFLPELNNELPEGRNSIYKQRLTSLKNLVLIMFEGDEVIVPKETAWFGFYPDGKFSPVLPVEQWDWIGMKRPRQGWSARPVTFSPFARSVANIASSSMVKRQKDEDKVQESSQDDLSEESSEENVEETKSESDEESSDGVVQADFAFFDPKPEYFHGVKTLLQTYLDSNEWDLSGFVDLILEQTTVGTVVKLEDDEDDGLFSVATALNLARYKASDISHIYIYIYIYEIEIGVGIVLPIPDHNCIKELQKYALNVCHETKLANKLRLLLSTKAQDVGLLVSQRVVNLPPQLLPPLYDALFDEISWAVEDEHKKANDKTGKSVLEEEPVIYVKAEDELFHELSSWSFTFPLKIQHVTTSEATKELHINGVSHGSRSRQNPEISTAASLTYRRLIPRILLAGAGDHGHLYRHGNGAGFGRGPHGPHLQVLKSSL